MYSICARSSYGWICASYSIDGRNITSKGKHVTFASSSFDVHLMLVDKDHERCWRRTETELVDRATLPYHPWSPLLLVYYGQIGWTRRDWKCCSGHFFLICFSQSALSSCVYMCQKTCGSENVKEGSAQPSSCWWNTNAYTQNTMGVIPVFFFKSFCYTKVVFIA